MKLSAAKALSKTKALSTIKASAIVLAAALAADAQFNVPKNARKDAISGTYMKDISGIYKYPALINSYADHVQATWYGTGGGVFGTKSVNDIVSIGILANQGLMAPRFAEAAAGLLNGALSAGDPGDPEFDPEDPGLAAFAAYDGAFDNRFNIPHLLVGFDLGRFKLGAEAYFEYAGLNGRHSNDFYYGDFGYDSSGAAYIMHPGFKLGAHVVGLGPASLLAKFGMGFPSAGITIDSDSVYSPLSTDALYMEMGAEATVPFAGIDWVAGADYARSSHSFKTGSDADSAAETETNSLLNMYVGGEFNFMEKAIAAFGYSFARNMRTVDKPDHGEANDINVKGSLAPDMPAPHRHTISAGIENIWDKAWFFDSFQLRGGVAYVIESRFEKIVDGDDVKTESTPATHGVAPSIGLSVSKDFFTLDLSLNVRDWVGDGRNGIFAGPPVGVVTGTVKF
jgi:hypothetical protein